MIPISDEAPEKKRSSSRSRLEAKEKDLEQKQDELRRQHFIKAAETCFLDAGVANTTMEDVAQEAGFSVGMIYKYFDHKEDLCVGITHQIHNKLFEKIDRILDQHPQDVEETLRNLSNLILSFWEEHTEVFEIFYAGNHSRKSTNRLNTQKITDYLYQQYTEKFNRLFGRWVEEDRIEGEPEILTNVVWGSLASYIANWSYRGRKDPLRDKAEEFMDIFLRGLQYSD